MECRNDSIHVSKMQHTVVVHEPTLTFILRSLMNCSPCCHGLFKGDGLDVHLGIFFLEVDCLPTFFFPKELSQPLHIMGILNAVYQLDMSTHDALITTSMLSLLGGLFLQFKHLHLLKHCCPLRTHGQRVTFSLLFHLTRRTPVTLISCVGHSGKPSRYSATLN